MQLLNERSFATFYLGSEREVPTQSLPGGEQQLRAGCAWSDLYRELNLPYQGAVLSVLPANLSSTQTSTHLTPGSCTLSSTHFDFVQFAQFSGFKEVFAKKMTYRFKTHLDAGTLDDVIPREYVHVFLIRDPRRSVHVQSTGNQDGPHVCQRR